MSAAAADRAQRKERSTVRAVTWWRHARAIALLPFMNTVVIPAAILVASSRSLGFPPDRTTAVALALGGAAIAVGVALAGHSIRLFAVAGQGTLAPWDPTAALVMRGAYRYVRNPMKLGLFLILLGEAVVLRSLALLCWFAVFAAANVAYIRLFEERGLRKRFGTAYERYCARVPRWLPSSSCARVAVEGSES
jgi:protein-S-isoprenylcysteine O-methyltransferase Ste14